MVVSGVGKEPLRGWLPACVLSLGGLLAWLCSVLRLDIEQAPQLTHPSRGHTLWGPHQHLQRTTAVAGQAVLGPEFVAPS